MNLNRLTGKISLALLAVAIVFSGCKKEDDPQLPPIDTAPEIHVLTPSNALVLAEVGEVVNMSFELYDNELITSYKATEKWTSNSGVVVRTETDIPGTLQNLSTQVITKSLSYTVPSVPVYTQIEIRAYVYDNKGRVSSTIVHIDVVPGPGDTTTFNFQEYSDGDTIWNNATTPSKSYFDIVNRTEGSSGSIPGLQQDLHEISTVSFLRQLNSPNNGGTDSVLVHTDITKFDYDNLTYQTTWEAFVTSNKIGKVTPVLNTGDVVILKMTAAPHYAVLKITGIGSDYIAFVYKYSRL